MFEFLLTSYDGPYIILITNLVLGDYMDILSEDLKRKKQKMMNDLAKEVNKDEKYVNHYNLYKAKLRALKNLKIIVETGKLFLPYVLAAGITTGGFMAVGKTPFYKDDCKQPLEIKKEFDSLGNIRIEQQYFEYENVKNTLFYYSKWDMVKDNLYSRDIYKYYIPEISEDKMMELIDGNLEDLYSFLGEPTNIGKETKVNLSLDEINSSELIEAVVYLEDEDNYIIIKESSSSNVGYTMLWLLFLMFTNSMASSIRKYSKYDYAKSIEEIKSNTKPIDIDELKRKLMIKKDNYERLMRK